MILSKEIITSRNNATVKWVASLHDKKGRQTEKAFIAEGFKLSFEALEAGLPVSHVFISENKFDEYFPKLKGLLEDEKYSKTIVCVLSEGVFEKISTEKAPQGVISVIKYLDFFFNMNIIYKEEFFLEEGERAIALYQVRDPSNLGAVIRSSVAFGVDHIILSDDCADVYNPKTIRSAMGSMFRVKISKISDFKSFVCAAKANCRRIFAAELTDNASSISDIALNNNDIVIIGNEGHGIAKDVSEICTGSVYIPISKNTESLNASVAAAIFMWEQSKKG